MSTPLAGRLHRRPDTRWCGGSPSHGSLPWLSVRIVTESSRAPGPNGPLQEAPRRHLLTPRLRFTSDLAERDSVLVPRVGDYRRVRAVRRMAVLGTASPC